MSTSTLDRNPNTSYNQTSEDSGSNWKIWPSRRLGKTSETSSSTNPSSSQLAHKCFLIRNLPAGIAPDYMNQWLLETFGIRATRIVYGDNHATHQHRGGAYLVELASASDRNALLRHTNSAPKDTNVSTTAGSSSIFQQNATATATDSSNSTNTSKHTLPSTSTPSLSTNESLGDDSTFQPSPPAASLVTFPLPLRFERCRSDQFVTKCLDNSYATSVVLTAGTSEAADSRHSPPLSSSLAKRCLLVRATSASGSNSAVWELLESHVVQLIHGCLHETIRRATTLRANYRRRHRPVYNDEDYDEEEEEDTLTNTNHSNERDQKLPTAVMVELESDSSVHRLVRKLESSLLRIPIRFEAVKSDKYARSCFFKVKRLWNPAPSTTASEEAHPMPLEASKSHSNRSNHEASASTFRTETTVETDMSNGEPNLSRSSSPSASTTSTVAGDGEEPTTSTSPWKKEGRSKATTTPRKTTDQTSSSNDSSRDLLERVLAAEEETRALWKLVEVSKQREHQQAIQTRQLEQECHQHKSKIGRLEHALKQQSQEAVADIQSQLALKLQEQEQILQSERQKHQEQMRALESKVQDLTLQLQRQSMEPNQGGVPFSQDMLDILALQPKSQGPPSTVEWLEGSPDLTATTSSNHNINSIQNEVDEQRQSAVVGFDSAIFAASIPTFSPKSNSLNSPTRSTETLLEERMPLFLPNLDPNAPQNN